MDLTTRIEERAEEPKALQVVEMKVAEQNVDSRCTIVGHRDSERTHACACVEHQQLIVVSTYLYAGGVAAISERVGAGRGQ